MLSSILAAVKAKAPIVAIPAEGHAPLCITQKLLKGALKGVTIVSTEVITHDGGKRSLKITGRAGAVRTSCLIHCIDRRIAQTTLAKWAEKERVKLHKKIAQGGLTAAGVKEAKRIAMEAQLHREEHAEAYAAKDRIESIRQVARRSVHVDTRPVPDWQHAPFAERRALRPMRKRLSVMLRRLKAYRAEHASLVPARKYIKQGRRMVLSTQRIRFTATVSAQLIRLTAAIVALRDEMLEMTRAALPSMIDSAVTRMMLLDSRLNRKPSIERSYGYRPDYDRPALAQRLREARAILAKYVLVMPGPQERDTGETLAVAA